jgi:hypothetical protein
MAKVRDRCLTKETLGALGEEVVITELLSVVRTCCKCLAHVGLNISISSKKTSMKRRRKGFNTSFIKAWNVAGALVKLNGITKNSKWS